MNAVSEQPRIVVTSPDAYVSLPDLQATPDVVGDAEYPTGAAYEHDLGFEGVPVAGRFPEIRDQLHEAYRGVSDDEIERWVIENFEGMSADDLENFMKSLKSFGKSAGKTLGQAAPGMLSGAMSGATVGMAAGPYGALIGAGIGAIGGGAVSVAQQQNKPAAQPAPQQPATPRAPAPVAQPTPPQQLPTPAISHPTIPTPAPSAPVAPAPPPSAPRPGAQTAGNPPGASAIITQLLGLLSQPQVIQAVTSLAMQRAGRETVRFADAEVPTINVLSELARLSNDALAVVAVSPSTPRPSTTE